ncbi:peptidase M16 [Bacteroidia bacterium]|nr:peptidase M16 [Bacteroidia bacterium]
MKVETIILPNGIRLVHKREKAAAAYCGMSICAGTRNELPKEHGLAHFLEHTLFKGTSKRDSLSISSFLEQEGGDLNAFTTKEETMVHAAVLTNDLDKAVDIIGDIIFCPTFPADELKKEKDVICDEINLYKDNPAEQIFDEFESLIFPHTNLGRSILGTAKSVKSFTPQMAINFAKRCYTTDKMVFASVGDFDIGEVEKLAKRYFLPTAYSSSQTVYSSVNEYVKFAKKRKKDTYQAHCLLGNRGYHIGHKYRFVQHLLTNLLGGPSQNSRLNIALREQHGLSYGVEVAATSYADTGVVSIYFGTEKNAVDKCFDVVNKELTRICKRKMSSLELQRVKKQFLGQQVIAAESHEQQMLSMAKSMTVFGYVETLEDLQQHIMDITAEQILEAANELFAQEQLSTLLYI